MNINGLKTLLEETGWAFFLTDQFHDTGVDWRAALRTDGLPECLCNDRSPQVLLTPWRYQLLDTLHETVDVEVCGETHNGWVQLKAYGLPLDMGVIRKASEAMQSAWSAAFGEQTPIVTPEERGETPLPPAG